MGCLAIWTFPCRNPRLVSPNPYGAPQTSCLLAMLDVQGWSSWCQFGRCAVWLAFAIVSPAKSWPCGGAMLPAPASRIAVLALRSDVAAISAVIVGSGRRTPARRYVSYLTPGGFAEKSRLMRESCRIHCPVAAGRRLTAWPPFEAVRLATPGSRLQGPRPFVRSTAARSRPSLARWRVLLTRLAGTWICCGLSRSSADHRLQAAAAAVRMAEAKLGPKRRPGARPWARGRAARGGMTTTELRGATAVPSRRAQPVQPSRESYLRSLR
jgi:hypothetical protein